MNGGNEAKFTEFSWEFYNCITSTTHTASNSTTFTKVLEMSCGYESGFINKTVKTRRFFELNNSVQMKLWLYYPTLVQDLDVNILLLTIWTLRSK